MGLITQTVSLTSRSLRGMRDHVSVWRTFYPAFNPTSVTFNGAGAGSSECGYGNLFDGLYPGFQWECTSGDGGYLGLAPGTQVQAVIHCSGYTCDQSGNCVPNTADAPPYNFVLDDAPPTVTITSPRMARSFRGDSRSRSPGQFQAYRQRSWILTMTLFMARPRRIGNNNRFGHAYGVCALFSEPTEHADHVRDRQLGVHHRLCVVYYTNAYRETFDPSAGVSVYIDIVPPVVTFDLGTSATITTLSAISGLVTDNFQLGHYPSAYKTPPVGIVVLEYKRPKFGTFVPLSAFSSGSSIQIQIPITSGPGINRVSGIRRHYRR